MTGDDGIPRDPSHYSPSVHAGQQRKHRGIDWEIVADTIQHGEVLDKHEDDCVMFVQEYEQLQAPVGVVANYKMGVLITIEFRK